MTKKLDNTEQSNELISRRFKQGPVFSGFAQYILDIRRNLIALSFLVLTYKLSGAEIAELALLGIKFKEIKSGSIDLALFGFLLYNLVHFIIEVFVIYQNFKMLTRDFEYSIVKNQELQDFDDQCAPPIPEWAEAEEEWRQSQEPDEVDIMSGELHLKHEVKLNNNVNNFVRIKKYLKIYFMDVFVPIGFVLWAIYCVFPPQYFGITLASLNILLGLLLGRIYCKLKFTMA